ncbi:MAG: response regulator transcription factor [Massilia sp.]
MNHPDRPAPHIALVDDDADVRVGLHALLRSYGYRVTVYDGAQALLAAGVEGIDCVVSDVNMPGMDGFELLDHLRASAASPPCILMTALPDNHKLRARALRSGAACFLGKPVDAEALAACIAATGATPA